MGPYAVSIYHTLCSELINFMCFTTKSLYINILQDLIKIYKDYREYSFQVMFHVLTYCSVSSPLFFQGDI
jgi:hypothetical protein